jgi:hypothetical protein
MKKVGLRIVQAALGHNAVLVRVLARWIATPKKDTATVTLENPQKGKETASGQLRAAARSA